MGSGDSERAVELQKLLRRLRPRILEVLRGHRVPEAEAAEIVHDTFIALAVRWNRIGNREAWLMGTLEARCRELARCGSGRGGDGGPGSPTGLDE